MPVDAELIVRLENSAEDVEPEPQYIELPEHVVLKGPQSDYELEEGRPGRLRWSLRPRKGWGPEYGYYRRHLSSPKPKPQQEHFALANPKPLDNISFCLLVHRLVDNARATFWGKRNRGRNLVYAHTPEDRNERLYVRHCLSVYHINRNLRKIDWDLAEFHLVTPLDRENFEYSVRRASKTYEGDSDFIS